MNTATRGLGIALLRGVTLAADPTDEPAADQEVARLSLLYPFPWVRAAPGRLKTNCGCGGTLPPLRELP